MPKLTLSDHGEIRRFWLLLALGGVVLAVGMLAAYYMEEHGHIVTGMNNQIVWGTPHVFAIFLIVAASGVLNIASIGSVFGHAIYKSRARLSGLLSIAMLAGGLTVLMLDLGRPDRIIVAATHYNFTSMFAWNVFLYSGLVAVVAFYLWTMMERRMNRHSQAAGTAAFIWRIVLTTGTGSIFGFLVARQAYSSAVLGPLFLAMSLSWGLAVFLLAQAGLAVLSGTPPHAEILRRKKNLLGLFVATVAYLMVVYHLTNLYFARQVAFEHFILLDGGVYPLLLWAGYVVVGTVLPLVLIWGPGSHTERNLLIASVLVVVGGFAQLYVFIIGGQAFPLEIFPGYAVSSSFADGQVTAYTPSVPEVLLGLGGIAIAYLITLVGVRVLDFLPHEDAHYANVATGKG